MGLFNNLIKDFGFFKIFTKEHNTQVRHHGFAKYRAGEWAIGFVDRNTDLRAMEILSY